MLKFHVLSSDHESSMQLIELISEVSVFSFVSLSYDLVELIISANLQQKKDVIIVDKYIDESKISKLTDIFSLVFKYVIYAKNERSIESLGNSNIAFLKSPYSSDAFKKIAKKFEDDNILNVKAGSKQNFDDHFFIRCEKGKIRRINVDEILFIEADQNYMNFHQQEESYTVNFTLNGIEKALPPNRFIRIHRSFIINVSKIRSIEATRILIGENIYVPIGQSYRKKIFGFFNEKILYTNKDHKLSYVS